MLPTTNMLFQYNLSSHSLSLQRHIMIHNLKFIKNLSCCFEKQNTNINHKSCLQRLRQHKITKNLNITNSLRSNSKTYSTLDLIKRNAKCLKEVHVFPNYLLYRQEYVRSLRNLKNLSSFRLPPYGAGMKIIRFFRRVKTLDPNFSGISTKTQLIRSLNLIEDFLHHLSKPIERLVVSINDKANSKSEHLNISSESFSKIQNVRYIFEQHYIVPLEVESFISYNICSRIQFLDIYIRESSLIAFILNENNSLCNLRCLSVTVKETMKKQLEDIINCLKKVYILENLNSLNIWIIPTITNKDFFSFLMSAKLPEGLNQLNIHAQIDGDDNNNSIVKRRGQFFFNDQLKDLSLHIKANNFTSQVLLTFVLIQAFKLMHLKDLTFKVSNHAKDIGHSATLSAPNYYSSDFRLSMNDVLQRLDQLRSLETFSIMAPYLIFNGLSESNSTTSSINKITGITLIASYSTLPCNLNSYIRTIDIERIQNIQIDTKEILNENDFLKRVALFTRMQHLCFLSTDTDVRQDSSKSLNNIYQAFITMIKALKRLEILYCSIRSLRYAERHVDTLSRVLEYHQKLILFNFTANNFNLYRNLQNNYIKVIT